jgi:hypothetical protein
MTIVPERGESCRAMAAECEARARQAEDPVEAAQWREVARSWLLVAQELDASAAASKEALH